MKRFCLIFCIISLIVALPACANRDKELLSPVTFYYCREELTYGQPDSVILGVPFEAAGHQEDLEHLLSEYLKGPTGDELKSPFPSGTKLVSIEVSGWNARIVLSTDFARLAGLDLTIACSCITKTVAELAGVQTVTIRAEDAQLDGSAYIMMDVRNILLEDTSSEKIE